MAQSFIKKIVARFSASLHSIVLIAFVLTCCMALPNTHFSFVAEAQASGTRNHSGFSGLPYFVPRSSRLTLYKYRALSNHAETKAHDMEGLEHYSDPFSEGVIVPGSAVSDCSVNIGNIFTDGATGGFGDRENVVIIDGDVINAGDCR